MRKKKPAAKKAPRAAAGVLAFQQQAAAGVLTFQQHPLLQIRDADPSSADHLEILLRPDSVRISTICFDEKEGRSHSLHISPADFEAFVERGRAHAFETSVSEEPDAWTFRENPLLQLLGESLNRHHCLEILLRPDGVSFSMSTNDQDGFPREQCVRISPESFKALIERCRTHRFEI